MPAIAASQEEPEIERDERETDAVVLLDVPSLVRPQRVARLSRADDDVAERDRRVAAHRHEEVREATISHVEEAPVARTRPGEGQEADEVPQWIGMVSGERAQQIS